MAVQEVSFTIDWATWIPVIISGVALFFTVKQMLRNRKRDDVADWEAKIDRASEALKECEENLQVCGRQKDELRRENIELLRKVANMTPVGNQDGGE